VPEDGYTHISLNDVEDAAVANGLKRSRPGSRCFQGSGTMKLDDEVIEAGPRDAIRVAPRVARAFEAGPDGLEFLATGAHHPGDGALVDDPWVS
jgi:hypothetical protein